MANLSGTFKDPSAGTLMVFLSGIYQVSIYSGDIPYGSPSAPGLGYMRVGATVGGFAVPPIDPYSPNSFLQLDYPGGNTVWNYSTSLLSDIHPTLSAPGSVTWGFGSLQLTMTLYKK
jgi:hypothetical protein